MNFLNDDLLKSQINEDLQQLRDTVIFMLDANRKANDLEKLDDQEFNLDLEEKLSIKTDFSFLLCLLSPGMFLEQNFDCTLDSGCVSIKARKLLSQILSVRGSSEVLGHLGDHG